MSAFNVRFRDYSGLVPTPSGIENDLKITEVVIRVDESVSREAALDTASNALKRALPSFTPTYTFASEVDLFV